MNNRKFGIITRIIHIDFRKIVKILYFIIVGRLIVRKIYFFFFANKMVMINLIATVYFKNVKIVKAQFQIQKKMKPMF